MSDIRSLVKEYAEEVDAYLEASLPRSRDDEPCIVYDAMRYSIFAGGKRLRPVLSMMAAEAFGGDRALACAVCSPVELIHTYSLIHDDLPCMDDDDLRRGKPTCHKRFGEAVAVLTGDAMLTEAFRMIVAAGRKRGVSDTVLISIIGDYCEAAGATGIIAGQMADIAAEGRRITLDELRSIHRKKTGGLFTASLRGGACLAGADKAGIASIVRYGDLFGMAFQVTDDILDVEGTDEELGKPVGSDERNRKATWPSLTSLEEAKAEARRICKEAAVLARSIGPAAEPLAALALYLLERRS